MQVEGGAGVGNRRLDLAAVADDSGVVEQLVDVTVGEPCDLRWVEAGECAAETVSLSQDRQPGEARLEAFEAELLVDADLVDDGAAPLIVVIRDVVGCGRAPAATPDAVVAADGMDRGPVGHQRRVTASTRCRGCRRRRTRCLRDLPSGPST